MPFIIPVGSSPDNTQRVQISTQTYDFRYRWNSTEKAWYCHIGLNGEDPKVKFKVLVGFDLLQPYTGYEEVPDGRLILIDGDGVNGRPGRDNFGANKRFKLLFIVPGEDLSQYVGE